MFIHETADWPAFRWDNDRLIAPLSRARKETSFLAGRLSALGFDSQLAATVETVTHDVVNSSEIEGVSLNTAEVRSSVARRLGVPIADEKEPTHYVDGVVEMMLDATQHYALPLTEARLLGWHAALFPMGRSGMYPIEAGTYRTGGMEVVSGAFGRERIHYRAPVAERVGAEMAVFLQWLNGNEVPPSFIKSAIAHFWFVCIHPFDDGNGRIARAISDMVLSQTDRSSLRCFSMSMQINHDKRAYYRVLEAAQRGDGDITDWLEWYLCALERAAEASAQMLSAVLRKAVFWRTFADTPVTERQRGVMNRYLDGYDAKLTVKNWARLADVSPDTAARDIRELVAKGVLSPVQGRVRDVSYVINYVRDSAFPVHFTAVQVVRQGEAAYLSAIYKNVREVRERILPIDLLRIEQGEVTPEGLLYKYFAYLGE